MGSTLKKNFLHQEQIISYKSGSLLEEFSPQGPAVQN